jgi:hypothetical protein
MNQDRDQVLFQVDDHVVMVCVQVQSNATTNHVAKLSYHLRRPVIIKEVLGHGAYAVA